MAELEPLPDDIQALLERARDGAPPPPPGAESSVLAQVTTTVGMTSVSAAVGAAGAGGLAWAKLALALAGTATLAVAGITVLRAPSRDASTTPAIVDVAPPRPTPNDAFISPSPIAQPPTTDVAAAHDAIPPTATPSDAAVAESEPEPRPVARAANTARPNAAAEGALVEAARDALARGDADVALRKLEEHQRAFGARGRLVEERHALTVVAFAQKGDAERARGAAQAFFRLYPRSLFGDTVRAAAKVD